MHQLITNYNTVPGVSALNDVARFCSIRTATTAMMHQLITNYNTVPGVSAFNDVAGFCSIRTATTAMMGSAVVMVAATLLSTGC
jgi:precorrin-2 methylase